MADLSEGVSYLALQSIKTLYLHYHDVYGHQILGVVTYHEGLQPIKSDDPFITCSCDIT